MVAVFVYVLPTLLLLIHIFDLVSTLCSDSSFAMLLDHTHLPCEPTHESYHDTSIPLYQSVSQATPLADIARHTSVCIHSCTS